MFSLLIIGTPLQFENGLSEMKRRQYMEWIKHGLIFDPAKFIWDKNFVGFAQSPQTLIFPNSVRVYFATRIQDPSDKFISHIRYVDFSRDMRTILDWSRHEVLGPGKLGCFDEHGVFPLNVVPVDDKIYGYTNGWSRRVSVSVETGVGLVISHDQGRSFQRYGDGPVLSATAHEPVLVGDAFVLQIAGRFIMWYIFGTGWRVFTPDGNPERTYKISMATSDDGINWQKSNRRLIPDRLGPDECQALPSVLIRNGRYHMMFCYRQPVDFRQNTNNGYRLGYAWSDDGENWARDDALGGLMPSPDGWDSKMICYPHLFEVDGQVYLLYNGNEFGRHGFGLASLSSGLSKAQKS